MDDVHIGMQWMLENHSFLDARRVGIIGWSHGGLITLMNIFQHPKDYAVAYAGVPAPGDTPRFIPRLTTSANPCATT